MDSIKIDPVGTPQLDTDVNPTMILGIIVIMVALTIVIIWYFNKIPTNTLCPMPIMYYKAILDQGPLAKKYTRFSTEPNYLTPVNYCNSSDIPRMSGGVPARYIAIIGHNRYSLTIPAHSIKIYVSETDQIPVTPMIDPVIAKVSLVLPDSAVYRNSIIFEKMQVPYNGVIDPNEVVIIKLVSNYNMKLYSFSFKYTGTQEVPLSLYLFNPPSTYNYLSGEPTQYTSFYQINLENIKRNITNVIDFA